MKLDPVNPLLLFNLEASRKVVGRKLNPRDEQLRQMFHCGGSKVRSIRMEYLRCRIIRGHKRLLRHLLNGTSPGDSLNNIDLDDTLMLHYFLVLKTLVHQNSELRESSATRAGPKQWGVAQPLSPERSFNQTFCSEYFRPEPVRQSYYYYIELLFSKLEAQTLCRRFKLKCCDDTDHSGECLVKWLVLKEYLQTHVVSNAGQEPWLPQKMVYLPSMQIPDTEFTA